MRALRLASLFILPILPTLQAAKNTTSKLEQPKAVKKAKTPAKAPFNAFRDDSFLFSDFRSRAFENKPSDHRADRFPEAYNPWNEDAARTKAAFSY